MEDGKIVGLFLHRNEEGIRAAEEKYSRYCRSIAGRILNSEEDSEECVNDALLAAWNSIPPQRPERLSTYLGKLTRQLALSRLRAENALKRGGGEVLLSLEELEDCIPENEQLTDTLETAELAACVSDFLRALPQTERILFLRRYWFFDSIKAICETTGFGESRVKMTLKRTRDKLAQVLKKEGYVQ